jgi:hypothetical protein
MICAGEFAMAHEAFALSPISARAALPSEEDYEAISQAFMETSRGRWFLGEYAKRNRNADTRMVLDAVERIEQTIAAQKQPAPDNSLAEAMAALRHTVDQAQDAAAAALDSLALEEHLAPVRKGARIIREISWRWREIGADARICDLLDSQVGSIEAACGQIFSAPALGALGAAFDLIKDRIAGFDEGDAAAATRSPFPASADEMPSATSEEAATDDAEAAIGGPEMSVEAPDAMAETSGVAAEIADVSPEAAEVVAEAVHVTSEGAAIGAESTDAYDDALLDAIALEMAAPDPSDVDDRLGAGSDELEVAESPADPILVAEQSEPMAASVFQASLQLSPAPSPQLSLGSTLLANGIVRRPHTSAADPLAPIRRMSQAEKIAFFS